MVKIIRPKEIEDYSNNLAKEIESQYSLPNLKGSAAQIKWARDIRIKFLNKALDQNLSLETLLPLHNKTSASWWINNKGLSLEQIIEESLQQ